MVHIPFVFLDVSPSILFFVFPPFWGCFDLFVIGRVSSRVRALVTLLWKMSFFTEGGRGWGFEKKGALNAWGLGFGTFARPFSLPLSFATLTAFSSTTQQTRSRNTVFVRSWCFFLPCTQIFFGGRCSFPSSFFHGRSSSSFRGDECGTSGASGFLLHLRLQIRLQWFEGVGVPGP